MSDTINIVEEVTAIVRLAEAGPQGPAGNTELGYAAITSDFSGTATTLTDIAGLTVTVTVGSRPILVKFQADAAMTTAVFTGGVYLVEDGTDIGVLAVIAYGGLVPTHGVRRLAPSSGSHTYKLRYKSATAGTVTIKAGPGNAAAVNGPAFLQVVEV